MITLLEGLFATGRIVDFALLLMGLEALIIIIGFKKPFWPTLSALLPGLCLFMALRAALTDAGWLVTAAWLAISLPVHLNDMRLRLK